MTGRSLTRTVLRLIVRFFLWNYKFAVDKYQYIFTLKYNKTLRHFLLKSILKSIRYYSFPLLCLDQIYTVPHSLGVKLRKIRRL